MLRGEIIDALTVLGGKAKAYEVYDAIEEGMKDRFLPGDFDKDSGGGPVWKKKVSWARVEMKNAGVLRSDSPKGEWELSEDRK